MKERWQAIKTWFLCYQFGCEPEADGSWTLAKGGGWVLLEPQRCARCKRKMKAGEHGTT